MIRRKLLRSAMVPSVAPPRDDLTKSSSFRRDRTSIGIAHDASKVCSIPSAPDLQVMWVKRRDALSVDVQKSSRAVFAESCSVRNRLSDTASLFFMFRLFLLKGLNGLKRWLMSIPCLGFAESARDLLNGLKEQLRSCWIVRHGWAKIRAICERSLRWAWARLRPQARPRGPLRP